MVAAIVAGDPAGLAAAYDRYASELYGYCRSLLMQPADAAEAVRDTFIVATAKLSRLRDRDLARPWLFAVARNECRRRLRDRAPAAPARVGDVGDAGGVSGATAGVTASAGRPAERELVDSAIRSLSPAERDAVELCMRHDLDDEGLAATLGMSRAGAHALVLRARKRFETSLGALIVAGAGPQFCPGLAAVLAEDSGGALTAAVRRQVDAHIRRCSVCGERKRRKLQATMLFGLGGMPLVPDDVWRQILGLVTASIPGGGASRAHIAARAEPFGKSGFPVPLGQQAAAGASARPVLAALAVVAIFAAISAGTVIMTGLPHGGPSGRHQGTVLGRGRSQPTSAIQAPALPARTTAAAATARARHPVRATVPAPTAVPTATTPGPTLTPGTLTAWPATVTLQRSRLTGAPAGSFTLTANGGPVAQFTITIPAEHTADLVVTPAAGSLAAGQSMQVSVTLRKNYHTRLQTQLLVQPGGLAVTVVYRPPHQ
jgi:RNA polymerase sigma factor (sigma-70 family)